MCSTVPPFTLSTVQLFSVLLLVVLPREMITQFTSLYDCDNSDSRSLKRIVSSVPLAFCHICLSVLGMSCLSLQPPTHPPAHDRFIEWFTAVLEVPHDERRRRREILEYAASNRKWSRSSKMIPVNQTGDTGQAFRAITKSCPYTKGRPITSRDQLLRQSVLHVLFTCTHQIVCSAPNCAPPTRPASVAPAGMFVAVTCVSIRLDGWSNDVDSGSMQLFLELGHAVGFKPAWLVTLGSNPSSSTFRSMRSWGCVAPACCRCVSSGRQALLISQAW
jgi:hypothetical protein